jgi:hypothetical protein
MWFDLELHKFSTQKKAKLNFLLFTQSLFKGFGGLYRKFGGHLEQNLDLFFDVHSYCDSKYRFS